MGVFNSMFKMGDPTAVGRTAVVTLISAAFSLLTFGQSAWSQPKYAHTGPTIITNVSVIDGLGNEPLRGQDLIIEDGKIAAIGATGSLMAPSGAKKIDGTRLTAMPGLMDLHIHTQGGWANGLIPGERYAVSYEDDKVQQRLSGYLYAGVTTVLDVGADHDWVVKTRDRINSGELFGPRHFTTGVAWSSKPSGWDAGNTGAADFGLSTIVGDVSDLPAQLDRYKKDGVEIIKLYAGIGTVGMQALIAEAHKRDMLTIADLWMLNLNRQVAQTTGLDGWAHTGGFSVASKEDQEWMAANNRFVTPTLSLGETLAGLRVKDEDGQRLMSKEPLIVDIWGKEEVDHFYDVYPKIRDSYYDGPDAFYQLNNFGKLDLFPDRFLKNAKASFDAGVLQGCGTDDIYAGMWPGESTHREMELFVRAGLPPLEAIKACTHDSARILRRAKEFGSLQAGLSADILIVEGEPSKNISDSRNVRHVFVRGKEVDRDSLKSKQ